MGSTRLDSTRIDSTRLGSTRLDSARLDSTRLDSTRRGLMRPVAVVDKAEFANAIRALGYDGPDDELGELFNTLDACT